MAATGTALRTADGIDLHVRPWRVPAGTPRRGSLLLVHGIGEHSGRYEDVAEALTALGLEVRSFDLRGHGLSGGARGVVPSATALVDDVAHAFAALAADVRAGGDAEPPFLLGHSMGGTLAARAATGGWVQPRGLVLSSPALAVSVTPVQRAMAALGRRLMPDRPVPNRLRLEGLSHDTAVVDAYRADELTHDRITARLYDSILAAADASLAAAPDFRVPTLLLVAGDDLLVDPRGSRRFAAALPEGVGELHVYDALYHELFNERADDRARVLADLRAWIEARTR
jgi:alpha-beta hydrolase superfamily lysophospholipase